MAVVLTSENSAAFYEKKMGIEPEPAPAKDAEVVVESADPDATPAEKEAVQQQAEPDPKEKKQAVNQRFSELSKARDEAKAQAETDRRARELAEKRVQELEAKLAPPAQAETGDPGPEPQRTQFTDPFEYAKALAQYSAEKALHERDLKDEQDRVAAEQAKVQKTFIDRQTALKAERPDYESVIAASTVMVSEEIRVAILDSNVGPQLLLYLAENPTVAQELNAMKMGPALRKFGKIEASLEKAKAAPAKGAEAVEPVAAATEISRAPAPISPLRGASAPVGSSVDSDGVFHGTYAEWKAQRKAGKIK